MDLAIVFEGGLRSFEMMTFDFILDTIENKRLLFYPTKQASPV